MLDTWIIAVCIAGGCVLLAVLVLSIYKCCQARKRKNNKRNTKGQNGHVWQAHSNDLELGDEEDSQVEKLNEDGLCKDTSAGSTFPRRIKAEEPNPKPRKDDGLCEDTEKRYTFPRRVKPEQELLLPVNVKNPSASQTALQSAFPVGVSIVTSFQRGNDENNVNYERLKSSNEVQHTIPKIEVEEPASVSYPEDTSVYRNGSKKVLKSSVKKEKRREAKMKRAKSFNMGLEDFPEYSKPVKRSASTPSIMARQNLVRNDKRFETLETWKSTIPSPEPDYQLPWDESSNTRPSKYDDQDLAPPSYATSDSGVECLDAFSGHDDESLNICDSVPESPVIPLSQLTPKDSNLYSSYKEHTSYKASTETNYNESNTITNTNSYGFQSNLLAMASKDYGAFTNANVMEDSISPSKIDKQDRFFQSTRKDNTAIGSPYNDPMMALRNTNDTKWKSSASNNPNNSIKTIERIEKTEQEMDFRSVKLRPTAKNYEESNTTNIHGVKQEDTVVTPLYQNEKTEHTHLIQQNQPYIKTEIEVPSSKSTQHPISNNVTDGPKDVYFLGFSKKPTVAKENNEGQKYSPETEKRTDFHRIKLRQIPQSLKEHIAFREDMEPNLSVTHTTPNNKDNVNSNTTDTEKETTVGVLDGIRKFQTQKVQGPKPTYGWHYISKKDPTLQPVHTDSKEAVTNLKPVNIVTPEPSTIDIGMRSTNSTSMKPKDVNVIRKDPLMVQTNVTRPASAIESVPLEDKRHFRYSTEKQNYETKEINASQKTAVLIREQDEREKANTTTSNHDLMDKPVAVVTPQSPKIKRETPEERAALEEERKKNWKREQIEQKLSTAHIKSQNEQIFQASGLAYKSCMPELFSKIKQIGEEKEQSTTENQTQK